LMVFVVALTLMLQSHEFWLEPLQFKIKSGEQLAVSFLVGEKFTGQSWDVAKNGVADIQLFEKEGTKDFRALVPKSRGAKLRVTLATAGTKILAMKSNAAFIELSAEQFNEYLNEDGLEEIFEWRVKNKQDKLGAKEFYTRYSKLIVQVDDRMDDTWRKELGHRLEIIPDQNPGSMKSGDYMGCKILYEGKAVPHILVKVWGHVGNKIFLQNIYSENDGTIKFPISARGPWLVSTVKMEKSKSPEADWESSWATLVFNIE
jgi:uncharacterized GH25 family protein